MTLNRIKRFAEEVLTAAELNAEFDNIIAKFDSNITAGDLDPVALPTYEQAISADNYSTLADALATAVNESKSLWLPAGSYTIDSPLVIPSNMRIQGAGPGVTILTGAASYGYTTLIQLGSNDNAKNIVISGLTIAEPSSFASTLNEFSGVKIQGAGNSGSNAILIEDVDFDFDTETAAGREKYCINISTCTGITITRCSFILDSTAYRTAGGIAISKGFGIDINNCQFNGGNYEIIGTVENPINSTGSVYIHDNVFEMTIGNFLRLPSIGGRIINNIFYAAATNTQAEGIYLAGDINVPITIADNVFFCASANRPTICIEIVDRSYVTITRNSVEAGVGGYPTVFVNAREEVTNGAWYHNIVPVSTTAYSGPRMYKLFTKKFDGDLPLILDDVYVWIRWNVTSTRNELCFSLTKPTTNNDYDSYVALTGTTNLVP